MYNCEDFPCCGHELGECNVVEACGNLGSLESSTTHPEQVTCLACAQILQDEQEDREGRRKKAESQRNAELIAAAFGLRLWE